MNRLNLANAELDRGYCLKDHSFSAESILAAARVLQADRPTVALYHWLGADAEALQGTE